MKTFTSVLILTVSFLSAGAFAGNPAPVQSPKLNVTVVYKNQLGPTKVEIVNRFCKLNFCREA
jgi:hypothetical protein